MAARAVLLAQSCQYLDRDSISRETNNFIAKILSKMNIYVFIFNAGPPGGTGADPELCIRGVLYIIIAREIFATTPPFAKPRPPSTRDRDQRVADMNRAPEIDLYSLKQAYSV